MIDFLVLGAGRSAGWLIDNLATYCQAHQLQMAVADAAIPSKLQPTTWMQLYQINVSDTQVVSPLVMEATVVVSLLPPAMHLAIAELCLEHGTHFLSASYSSKEMDALHDRAVAKGICLLNECGLDPGLDHVAACFMMDHAEREGGHILSFTSHCGGLPAPESSNDWGYRFFWNPTNVVRAGSDGAYYKQDGHQVLVPSHSVFKRPWTIDLQGETLEAYPNRDSIKYLTSYPYDLSNTVGFIRGTIRYPGFIKRWDALVSAGITNDLIPLSIKSYEEYISLFQYDEASMQLLGQLMAQTLANLPPFISGKSASAYLLDILLAAWSSDKVLRDRTIMVNTLTYATPAGAKKKLVTTLDIFGDEDHTAMSTTVGWPLLSCAIALISHTSWQGVVTPIHTQIWPYLWRESQNGKLKFLVKELPLS